MQNDRCVERRRISTAETRGNAAKRLGAGPQVGAPGARRRPVPCPGFSALNTTGVLNGRSKHYSATHQVDSGSRRPKSTVTAEPSARNEKSGGASKIAPNSGP